MKAEQGVRVLIVEDETLVGEMIQGLLEKLRYEVVGRVVNGRQAIEMVDAVNPDVVLMDIELPDMDGLEVTHRIYELCPTPVVVLTAYDTPELVQRASEVGVGAYLVKPPEARELERAIMLTRARFRDTMALRRLNAKLKMEIAERKRLASVLSHDLREPLRMVTDFLRHLKRHLDGKLDAEAEQYLGYAFDGAKRMEEMILALLEHSRLDTRGKAFALVDAEKILKQALDDLRVLIEEHAAVVTYDTLPMVVADDVQLKQIFQNLVDNAVKYHGENPPCVHISVHVEGEFWVFSVRDNGIGIDAEHFERIFHIFQRLHTQEEYPGLGIGLANCKKIVGRHGGRIWVESKPGEGATFSFTLPRNAPSTTGAGHKNNLYYRG